MHHVVMHEAKNDLTRQLICEVKADLIILHADLSCVEARGSVAECGLAPDLIFVALQISGLRLTTVVECGWHSACSAW